MNIDDQFKDARNYDGSYHYDFKRVLTRGSAKQDLKNFIEYLQAMKKLPEKMQLALIEAMAPEDIYLLDLNPNIVLPQSVWNVLIDKATLDELLYVSTDYLDEFLRGELEECSNEYRIGERIPKENYTYFHIMKVIDKEIKNNPKSFVRKISGHEWIILFELVADHWNEGTQDQEFDFIFLPVIAEIFNIQRKEEEFKKFLGKLTYDQLMSATAELISEVRLSGAVLIIDVLLDRFSGKIPSTHLIHWLLINRFDSQRIKVILNKRSKKGIIPVKLSEVTDIG